MVKRIIIHEYEDLKKLEQFNFNIPYSLDIETTSLRFNEGKIISISICNGELSAYINLSFDFNNKIKELKKYLCSNNRAKGKLIIGHNLSFDLTFLKIAGLDFYNAEWFDTMVAHHLLDEREEHKLKVLVQKYLDETTVSNFETIKINPFSEEFIDYNLKDAEWTYKLAKHLSIELREQGLEKLFRKIEMPFLRCVIEMQVNGIKVDAQKIESYKNLIEEKLIDLEIKILKELKIPFEIQIRLDNKIEIKSDLNLNSSQQLSNLLYDVLKLPDMGLTEKGQRKTGKEVINKLKDKHVIVSLIEEYKTYKKLLNAFLKSLPEFIDKDERIRPHFNVAGTRTGRLSCSDPNLQQLPKKKENVEIDVRSCFISSPGYKLISADYSGQELRVLAQVTMDEGLINAFRSGKDFHSETAKMFGVDRTKAKAINFGVAYRKSAFSFAKDWGTSEEEAQKFLDAYFNNFPKVKQKMIETDKFLNTHGYVVTLSGRKRRFQKENGYYPNKSYREAFNFLIQGFSSDMLRIAGIKILNLKKNNPEWDLRFLISVHDEFVFECKEEYAEEVAKKIKETMESSVKFSIPIISEVNIGNNYGELK